MRLDTHIHTAYSIDGVSMPRDVIRHARRFTCLDAIAITDHNRIFSKKEAEELTRESGMLVIPGIELGRLSSSRHIVALNVDHLDVGRLLKNNDPYEMVESISEQGGLSIAAHPVPRGFLNFFEIGFDAVEIINGGCALNNRLIKNPRRLPAIGCSDAHILNHIGRAWTEVDGVVPEQFSEKSKSSEIRQMTENVIEKIRRGLCHARGDFTSDALYLKYGYSMGKKYLSSSFDAIRSLVI